MLKAGCASLSRPTATDGLLNFSLNFSRVRAAQQKLLTLWYYITIHQRGRNAGIYTKETSVSSANLPLLQGDCHPALPIISFNHLSLPQITFAIFFQIEVSSLTDGRPPTLARLN
jgi:hypothetical protein